MIKKHWFLLGLMLVFGVTLVDTTGAVSGTGRWLKSHYGPDILIFLIFFVSGLLLEADQIKAGLKDFQGTLLALVVIYLVAPLAAALFALAPMETGVLIGLFLVAVVPTTLSSGVVMTGAAGGNMAHALVVTVIANSLSVLTVPFTLSLLLGLIRESTASIAIDKTAIMLKIGLFVLVPLCLGLLVKSRISSYAHRGAKKLQVLNQCCILGMVWMGVSQARETILSSGQTLALILVLSVLFHGILLLAAGAAVKAFKLERGRRESVIFMGGQKTLTLAILLQVSLFAEYGAALVVCVVHHVVHLMMDGYLVGWLKHQR